MAKDFELTEEHKQKILQYVQDSETNDTPLSLKGIAQHVFNDPKQNGQTVEGRATKKFLGEKSVNFEVRTFEKKGFLELTEEQKKKLDANLAAYIKKDINSLELAKIIYEKEDLSTVHQETRTVINYLNSSIDKMDGDAFKKLTFTGNFEDSTNEDYKPPRSLAQTLTRINRYVVGEDWKEGQLRSQQRKQAESLQNYLNTYRVKYEINSYPKQSQREVFEDAFVRYTYDKAGLQQEHLDMFCTLASERVNEVNIKAQINIMTFAMESQNNESEGRKIAMGLIEAITSSRTELNQCLGRQDKLYKALVAQRSKELETKKTENASMLNLVLAWQQQDYRRSTLHLAIKEKEKLRDEVKKLSSIGEIKAMLRGLTKEEIDSSFTDEEV